MKPKNEKYKKYKKYKIIWLSSDDINIGLVKNQIIKGKELVNASTGLIKCKIRKKKHFFKSIWCMLKTQLEEIK
jgi:hypothetical protein